MTKKKSNISSKELADIVIKGIQEKKGNDIVKLDLSNIIHAVSDCFIVCHGSSNVHVESIADSVIEEVKKECGYKPIHKEGFTNAEWILIDYFDVVVHIFQKGKRDFYHLEDLWADAKTEKIES